MQIIAKILIPIVLLAALKQISYSFYAGLISGGLLMLLLQYYGFVCYLRNKHRQSTITIDFGVKELANLIEGGGLKNRESGKKKHYVNSFSKEQEIDYNALLQARSPEEESRMEAEDSKKKHEQIENLKNESELIAKVHRKEFLKKIDLFCQFNDSIKDIENQHGQNLSDFEGLSVIFNKGFENSNLYLVDNQSDHIMLFVDMSDQHFEFIQTFIDTPLPKDSQLVLPTWKGFKTLINMIGKSHLEVSKSLASLITEQSAILKKEYTNEVMSIKKDKAKHLLEYQESKNHLLKVTEQFSTLDRDTKALISSFADMNKKREDPSVYLTTYRQVMIKQEMKIKLNLSELDTLRQKVFSAKERHKDIVEKASKFNDRIQQSEYRWEEQRLVYLKQGLQTQLLMFEDQANQIQQLVTQQMRVVLGECTMIHPKGWRIPFQRKRAKSYSLLMDEISALESSEQATTVQRYSDEMLSRLSQVQRYDDDAEYFIRELRNIFDRHTHNLEFEAKAYSSLWETSSGISESVQINVKSIFHALCGLKEIYKEFCTQLEKRRVEFLRHKLDISKELEMCLQRDLKKLQALISEDKLLVRCHEGDLAQQQQETQEEVQQEHRKSFYDKQKNLAKQFLSQVSSNVKNVSSIGQLVTTVGQTVSKINKATNLTKEQFIEKRMEIRKQCEALITVMGFTLKNLEELLVKHQRFVAREKKNIILDLCQLTSNLNSHFRKTIDEMSLRVKEAQSKQAVKTDESKTQKQVDWFSLSDLASLTLPEADDKTNDKRRGSEQLVLSPKMLQPEVVVVSPRDQESYLLKSIDKLVKVLVLEWQKNDYFKSKLSKMIHKSLNKKRPTLLGEIQIKDFQIRCDMVQVMGVHPQQQDEQEWLCDLEMHYKGEVRLIIETLIIINWPRVYIYFGLIQENYARLPVTVIVTITSFNGRLRVCFVPNELGKSWISFMGQPVLSLDIQPILAQKYNITNIPSVSDILREFIIQKVKLLTYPNKCSIKLPLSAGRKKS